VSLFAAVKVGDRVQHALNSVFGFLPRGEPAEGIDGLHRR
jgi:hypothetical protein